MRNFWRGTVSSICLMVACGEVYALPPTGALQGNTAVDLPPAGMVSQMKDLSFSMPVAMSTPLQAMAVHHEVVAGTATVSMTSPHELVVNQTSDRAIVNWDKFNVGVGDHVRFNQPGSESVTLNRVTGNHGPSEILGNISANGKVFILNPSGLIIGKEAVIDAAGFVGSTSAMTNEDFLTGKFSLTPLEGNESTITNHGTIRVQAGGLALIASGQVLQDGWIQAKVSTIEVEGHATAVVDFDGDGLLNLRIPVGQDQRPEGTVLVRSVDAQKLLQQCLNTEHCTRASHAEVKGGVVVISGKIELSPGAVAIQGQKVDLTDAISTASHGEQGGSISIHAEQEVALHNTHLDGSGTQRGGDVSVTGVDVSLEKTTLKANGQNGGGAITVGGSKGDTKPKSVTADKETVLSANAETRGDGGSIMVWSDEDTRFKGRVEATGGSESGNGGEAEVSGKISLDFQETKWNLSAPHGTGGKITFDPLGITFGGLTEYSDHNTYENDTITNIGLNQATFPAAGSVVVLQASTDININFPLTFIENTTVTLQGGRSILIPNNLTLQTSGDLVLRANDSNSGVLERGNISPGNINVSEAAAISVPGGTVSMIVDPSVANNHSPGAIIFNSSAGTVSSSGAQTYSGSITLTQNATLATTNAAVTITGGTIAGTGSLTINAGTGNLSLANSVASSNSLTFTAGQITLGAPSFTSTVAQTYTGPVVLGDDVVVNSGGNVNFPDAITGGGNDLSVTATGGNDIIFSDISGVAELSATADNINVEGSISTTGGQTYTGAVLLVEVTTLEATGAMAFSNPITGNYALSLISNSITAMTAPTSMTLTGGGYRLYFGGSAGGMFDSVTLNGVGGTAAAQYATLLSGTTGSYYVNGVLIGGLPSSMATNPTLDQVSVQLPQVNGASKDQIIEEDGEDDPIIVEEKALNPSGYLWDPTVVFTNLDKVVREVFKWMSDNFMSSANDSVYLKKVMMNYFTIIDRLLILEAENKLKPEEKINILKELNRIVKRYYRLANKESELISEFSESLKKTSDVLEAIEIRLRVEALEVAKREYEIAQEKKLYEHYKKGTLKKAEITLSPR